MKHKFFNPMRAFALMLACTALFVASATEVAWKPNVVYHIVSKQTGQALTTGGTTAMSSALQLADESATDEGQDWVFVPLTDGDSAIFSIVNANTGASIDMALTSTGTLIQWYYEPSNSNHLFYAQAVGDATNDVQLRNGRDGAYLLTASGTTPAMVKNGSGDATVFTLLETGKTPPVGIVGYDYVIQRADGTQVLSNRGSADNNAAIYADARDESQSGQAWRITPAPNVKAIGRNILVNYRTNMAIDMALDNKKTPLQWSPSSGSNQEVKIQAVSGEEDLYQLVYTRNATKYYLAASASGTTSVSQTATDRNTYFRLTYTATPAAPPRDNWEDETFFEENKEPAHAWYIPYATTAEMKADAEHYATPWTDPVSSRVLSLNGTWKLKWVQDVASRPGETDFWGDGVDVSSWADIDVPSCLEMKGYGVPLYINQDYAFSDNPPYIKMKSGLYNSAASYRRTFTLPTSWQGKRTVLHFDGIYSAAYVWVNGKYVGYTEGSNNVAEFDVTDHVRSGENNVSVQVIRWCDGSYLEGQDMWHMSGIHRDVFLYATQPTYIFDHYITSTLSTSGYDSGSLSVALTLKNTTGTAQTKKVSVQLVAPNGTEVASKTVDVSVAGEEVQQTVTFEGLTGLLPWTAETPNLYTVNISQLSSTGAEEEAFSTKYGFRTVTVSGGRVLINGQKVYFKGVNTQDTHPLYGRSIDTETMLKDVVMMKQANINTIRTAHYPRQAKMYAMFDYYGLYTMDEADVECHYNWSDKGSAGITFMESWRPQWIDRTMRMVKRDRNFPSIIFWSLGNESNSGSNFHASYDSVRAADPRPIHYEGATRAGDTPTDIYSVMYPSLSAVKSRASATGGKPYFMCEYAHAMGNAVGNLPEYWSAIESSTYGIGGCIWDWVDQSIVDAADIKSGTLTVNGYNKYRSGYDYGGPHQYNFCNNGLITADRAWTSKLTEVKKVYQNVKFTNYNTRTKKVSIKNANVFTSLDNLDIVYTVLKDGEAVETGTVDLGGTVAAGKTRSAVSLPFTTTADKGTEILVNVEARLKEPTSWADAGYVVAAEQFTQQERSTSLPAIAGSGVKPLTMTQSGATYTISNDSVTMRFTTAGVLSYWKQKGTEVLTLSASAPDYNNFRWVENDGTYDPYYGSTSYSNGISSKSLTATLSDDASYATVVITETGSLCNCTFTYTIYANGTVDLKAAYTPQSSDIRRIGMSMMLPKALQNVRYYANGPYANYVDRKSGSFLGRYTTTVADMFEEYTHPQSCGNHEGLRELLVLNNDATSGLRVQTQGQVAFSLLNYTDATLFETRHPWELTENSRIMAHFDYMQKGLGNASCGQGTGTLSDYQCPSSGTYTYTLRFTAYDPTTDGIDAPTASANDLRITHSADGQQLSVDGEMEAGTSLTVVNLGGVTLWKAHCAAPATHQTVDLSTLPRGTYILVVSTPSGQRAHKFRK